MGTFTTVPSASKWAVIAIAVLGLTFSLSSTGHAQQTLRISSGGGPYQEAQRRIFFVPFEKATGIKIKEDTWNFKLSTVRAMVEARNITSDLFMGNPGDAVAGCLEGILEPIDKSFLGDLSDFPPGAHTECGVASDIWTYIWVWNGDKLKKEDGPKTIADIFDNKKFPGKRSFRKNVYGVVEFALRADGVPRDKIYDVLGSPGGLDRAFAKLDTIRRDIVWWETAPQARHLLASGAVDFTQMNPVHSYLANTVDKKNFVNMWDSQIVSYDVWFMPKGTPNKAQAMKFLEFIMQPKVMAEFTNFSTYAGTRKSAMQYVKPEMLEHMPTRYLDTSIFMNTMFWADHLDSFTKRFEAWLQK